jgi:hypothetical protein
MIHAQFNSVLNSMTIRKTRWVSFIALSTETDAKVNGGDTSIFGPTSTELGTSKITCRLRDDALPPRCFSNRAFRDDDHDVTQSVNERTGEAEIFISQPS